MTLLNYDYSFCYDIDYDYSFCYDINKDSYCTVYSSGTGNGTRDVYNNGYKNGLVVI